MSAIGDEADQIGAALRGQQVTQSGRSKQTPALRPSEDAGESAGVGCPSRGR
jgi:hypothetical protein